MNTLFTILTILIVIASVFLVIVVLLQSGKDGGLASNFVAGNQTFGVRQTADFLEKLSWGLVAFILVLSIVTSFTTGPKGADMDVTNRVEQSAPQSAPEFPTAPIQQEAPTAPAQDAE